MIMENARAHVTNSQDQVSRFLTAAIIFVLLLTVYRHRNTSWHYPYTTENSDVILVNSSETDLLDTDSFENLPSSAVHFVGKNERKPVYRISFSKFQNKTLALASILEKTVDRDQSKLFFLFRNFFVGSQNFSSYDITIVTHGHAGHLTWLLSFLVTWRGPVAMTLFLSSGVELPTFTSLYLLTKCHEEFRERVTMHIVYPATSKPNLVALWSEVRKIDASCNVSLSYLQEQTFKNMTLSTFKYPVNLMRNLALNSSKTDFVMPLDPYVYTNKDFRERFLHEYALRRINMTVDDSSQLLNNIIKQIYVLPCFEMSFSGGQSLVSMNKTQIISAIANNTVQPCGRKTAPLLNRATGYVRWINDSRDEDEMMYQVRYWPMYQPYFVAKRYHFPKFHEELRGYEFDRAMQMCELHMKDYTINVLWNSFVVRDTNVRSFVTMETNGKDFKIHFKLAAKVQSNLQKKYQNKKDVKCF